MDAEDAAQILVKEYSRMAKAYEVHVVPQNRTLVRRLLELARVQRGEQVLDLGCGPGNLAVEAARVVGEQGHVEGIDLAEGMIRTASTRSARAGLQNIEFLVMDCRQLSYPRDTFDVVASCLGIPSVGYLRCLKETHRVLRRGGRLVFCVGSGGGTGAEVGSAFREGLETMRSSNPPKAVRRLLEARGVVNASGEPASIRTGDVTKRALEGTGFAEAWWAAEIHRAVFTSVDEYLRYQLAWGDNEREWRALSYGSRKAILKALRTRVARFVGPDGLSYAREVLFYSALKR